MRNTNMFNHRINLFGGLRDYMHRTTLQQHLQHSCIVRQQHLHVSAIEKQLHRRILPQRRSKAWHTTIFIRPLPADRISRSEFLLQKCIFSSTSKDDNDVAPTSTGTLSNSGDATIVPVTTEHATVNSTITTTVKNKLTNSNNSHNNSSNPSFKVSRVSYTMGTMYVRRTTFSVICTLRILPHGLE
jgi:hypothetical protein